MSEHLWTKTLFNALQPGAHIVFDAFPAEIERIIHAGTSARKDQVGSQYKLLQIKLLSGELRQVSVTVNDPITKQFHLANYTFQEDHDSDADNEKHTP